MKEWFIDQGKDGSIDWLIDGWMDGWMDWLIDWLIDRILLLKTPLFCLNSGRIYSIDLFIVPLVWYMDISLIQLKRLRAIVAAGGANYKEFLNCSRYLDISLQTAVKDLRSQVVREACVTLAYVSSHWVAWLAGIFLLKLHFFP